MEKTIKVNPSVHAKLLQKKAEIISVEGKNISWSDLIGRLLDGN